MTEDPYVRQLRLVGAALGRTPCAVCARVGRVVVRLLAYPEPSVRLVHAYVRTELCAFPSPPTPTVARLGWLVGATCAPLEKVGARLDTAWFATLVGQEASADEWAKAFEAYPTLSAYCGAYETLPLSETERAVLWMLLVERRSHQPQPGSTDAASPAQEVDALRYVTRMVSPPFTVTVARQGLSARVTTYRVHFVRLPPAMVRTVVAPLYSAISGGMLQWVTPEECTFVTTLHPLWTRRLAIVYGPDCVHDEWDGFDWSLAPRQMGLEQVSPLCTTLWETLQTWQGADAPAWDYATIIEYASTFADKGSEAVYQPLTSVVLADESLVVCVNLGLRPLHLRLRRYRGNPSTTPHRSTLEQGDAFVVPQAMLPLFEVAVSDPALAEEEDDDGRVNDGVNDGGSGTEARGAMLLTFHAAHPYTHYTHAEVRSILGDHQSSSSPDTDADKTTVKLSPLPSQRVVSSWVSGVTHTESGAGAGAGAGATPPRPHLSPALGSKTVVNAPPHVFRLDGLTRGRGAGRGRDAGCRGGRARAIVRLPVVHQLVGVHGRRFARNPKTKHWFAIVRTVDTTTGNVCVDYVNEDAFDDIDQPHDLLFPVDDTMLGRLERFVADDGAYAQVWRLVCDHVAQVRALEAATHSAAWPSPPKVDGVNVNPCKATPPPSMHPVHATDDQWRIQPQEATMGDGLWVVRGPRHTLFEYTTHACDIDHLVPLEAVDEALDTCAIVMRSAPDATTNVLAPRGLARGPGSYANAVDYRWDAEARTLVYLPEGEEGRRIHQANAELLEYDGKVYLRLTEALTGAYAMVAYGETYAGNGAEPKVLPS